MASFPALTSGKVTMYPAVREKVYGTQVARFVNDQEQRWTSNVALSGLTLQFTNISGYDLGAIREFWRSMRGRFDSTWDITFNGTTYSFMAFDSDKFSVVETKPERYSLSLKCKQVRQN